MKVRSTLVLILIALIFSSCAVSVSESKLPVSEYTHVISSDISESSSSGEAEKINDISVNYYMDNTGSMQAFIFDETWSINPSIEYSHLMLCLRDMGTLPHFTKNNYYYIGEDSEGNREWQKKDEDLCTVFSKKESYYSWISRAGDATGGPLTLLHLDNVNSLENNSISVIVTDLAEQNLHNTEFGKQVREYCLYHNYDVYLYCFSFEYNGNAEVPNPGNLSSVIGQEVHGKRPYYMLIFGPKLELKEYINELEEKLSDNGLVKNTNYYVSEPIEEPQIVGAKEEDIKEIENVTFDNIDFKESIDYEVANEQFTTYEKGGSGVTRYLKRIDSVYDLFDESDKKIKDLAAYEYEFLGGKRSWWLTFYVPQKVYDYVTYSWTYDIYYLENLIEEDEVTANVQKTWVRQDNSSIIVDDIEKSNENHIFSITKDALRENEKLPEYILIVINSQYETETIVTTKNNTIPDWLGVFDSGTSGEYFTKTYNFKGFYKALFEVVSEENAIEEEHIYEEKEYITIPILLTGLDD